MRAVVVTGHEVALRTDMSVPQPANDEALIRLVVAGICSTDLEIVKGYAGFAGVDMLNSMR